MPEKNSRQVQRIYLHCLYVSIMTISKMDSLVYKSCLNYILLYSTNEKYQIWVLFLFYNSNSIQSRISLAIFRFCFKTKHGAIRPLTNRGVRLPTTPALHNSSHKSPKRESPPSCSEDSPRGEVAPATHNPGPRSFHALLDRQTPTHTKANSADKNLGVRRNF